MTWTMRLININSMFALSYLIILTPIGKRKIPVYCGHFMTATTKADISRYNWPFIRCLSDIRTLISTDWKQSRLTCKYSMFWLYVCSGVSIISNAVLTLGSKSSYKLYALITDFQTEQWESKTLSLERSELGVTSSKLKLGFIRIFALFDKNMNRHSEKTTSNVLILKSHLLCNRFSYCSCFSNANVL